MVSMVPKVKVCKILSATEGREKHVERSRDTDGMVEGIGRQSENLRLIAASSANRGQISVHKGL